jgi:hypothetical protein
MQTFEQFKATRKLKAGDDSDFWCYGFRGTWQIEEQYPDEDDASRFVICGEEFKTLEEAEHALYNMYCDEEMLTAGY